MSTTTNYGWQKPDIGGSNGTWGTSLNADLDSIDSDLFDVSEAADAAQADADNAQATADEALAGNQAITPTVISTSGSFTASIDLDVGGPVYRIALVGAGTELQVTFTNRPATEGRMVWLHVSRTGGTATDVKIASASKQWAIPTSGDDVTATGTQLLGTVASGSQAVYALYIVAGV